MKGWKMWTGVSGIVLTRVAATYFGVDMEVAEADAGQLMDLIQAAFGALAVVGFGHKVEKVGNIIKAK